DYSRSLDSSFELVELIDIRRPIVPVNGDDHCQSNSGFSGGDRDGEDYDHHAGRGVRWRSKMPERDEIQIRRGEHHLDSDEDENGVTPAECCEQTDGKQRCGNDEESLECRGHGAAKWIG